MKNRVFDKIKIRKDFPILSKPVSGKRLVYLDNAATSQKPQVVIDAVSDYYTSSNANVHRGVHELSEKATSMYEEARGKVAKFIGAPSASEVIFTKGTTDSLNRVAFGWGAKNLSKGDVVIAVDSEHHSSLVPWQVVTKSTGATLEVLQVDENGELPLNALKEKLDEKVKMVAISHASNVLGTIFPVKEICKMAKEVGALVSVDGAQAVSHLAVNVQSLGCDFYSFSGHKMLGPMGIGVLWGRKEALEEMSPYEYGGGMIREVKLHSATFGGIPERFEAGTPNVAGAVGLAAAIDYIEEIGVGRIRAHEVELIEQTMAKLKSIKDLRILGPLDSKKRMGLVSFIIKGIHSHDIASVLSESGIAVRSGQHCTMPLHDKLGISSSTRASFCLYNGQEDVTALVEAVKKAKELLK